MIMEGAWAKDAIKYQEIEHISQGYKLHYLKLFCMNKEVDLSQKKSTKYETLIIRNKKGNTN
jgi:hypothetical protein